MKTNWLCNIVAASALAIAIPASGQVSIYIGSAPPPIRYEAVPANPGPGFAWIEGYWGVEGNRYVWVPGRWQRPPYPGAYWSHPHYDHYDKGWQYHEGHWDHEDHDNHHDAHHDDHHDDHHGH
jgi:hypothetical protein